MWSKAHLFIRQYRIIPLIITGFFIWLTVDMWRWFQNHHQEMKEWVVAAFSSLVLLSAGAVKWSLENFMKKIERDDNLQEKPDERSKK